MHLLLAPLLEIAPGIGGGSIAVVLLTPVSVFGVNPSELTWAWIVGLLVLVFGMGLLANRSRAATKASLASLRVLQANLDGMCLRIEELSSSHGRFIGNVAHELKSPLATILSHAEQLQDLCGDPSAIRLRANAIIMDVRHISDVVDSFLHLARAFGEAAQEHHEPIFFHDCVTEAVRRCTAFARTSGVGFVVTLAETGSLECTVEVAGDSVLLGAMIENLLRNAVRFSPKGGLVELRVAIEHEDVLLTVRDHGVGIAPERLETAFAWYFQEQRAAATPSGHGFGLAIVKRIAEHHRGTIRLQNHPQGGCEFLFRMPLLLPTASNPPLTPTHFCRSRGRPRLRVRPMP